MPYNSLEELVKSLEKQGLLERIAEFVDPELEIAEVTDRVFKSNRRAKALLFENTGTRFPVLTNLFASDELLSASLGIENPDRVSQRVSELLGLLNAKHQGFMGKLKLFPKLAQIARWIPRTISGKGACQEVVNMAPDLTKMPILKCWPHDGGRFITLPMVHTVNPKTGMRNLGMYRMQVFGADLTGMHWHRHKTGAQHYREYREKNELMPVAVAIGGDPVYSYCATAPLPENVDEYILAGFLRGKRVEMVKCITVDLEVPNDVDFVIEGYVDPSEDMIWEGPFGDHTGFYSLADWYPKFHVTCITHRKNAIYPATIVGVPPMEDAFIAKLTEKIFISPIRFTMVPEMADMHLPDEGVAHNLAIVSINKTYPGQAYKAGCALWGAGQMMLNKVMLMVDADVDVHNPLAVARAVAAHFNPLTDYVINKGPLDILDHSSEKFSFGGKILIDATRKLGEEIYGSPYMGDRYIEPDAESIVGAVKGVHAINLGLLKESLPFIVAAIDKTLGIPLRAIAHELVGKLTGSLPLVLVLTDKDVPVGNLSLVSWFVLGNIDVLRDCFRVTINEGKAACLVFDGTRKCYRHDGFARQWPNIVASSNDTIKKVDEKWQNLGLGSIIQSPSVELYPLIVGNEAIVPTIN